MFWRSLKISKGQLSIFEMDQNKIGGVINQLNKSGIGEHIYYVLCGRMTLDEKKNCQRKFQNRHPIVY
jgi:hypothetical protein